MAVTTRCDCATSLAQALMDPEPAERLPPVAIVVEGEAGGCLWCGSPAGGDDDAPAR